MAHTMTTKSGKTFTPLLIADVLEVVRDEMGDEVFNYLFDVIYDVDLEKENELSALKQEFHNYEMSCEQWHNFVEETAERVEKVREQIEDNKLTKAKISIELFKIYRDMRGEL